jgi:cyclophilin family peptidyl-prolyl cis-trans isomerase
MNVVITTSKGTIQAELDEAKAPISVANFLAYVDEKHYDNTIFHRVIKGFMLQGGGFTSDMKQKTTKNGIKNEWKNGLKNARGTLAMARLGGKADSATSQFFINTASNDFLDRPQPDGAAYAVFGRVTSGLDVVDQIESVRTTTKSGHQDVPAEPVVILSIRRA